MTKTAEGKGGWEREREGKWDKIIVNGRTTQ